MSEASHLPQVPPEQAAEIGRSFRESQDAVHGYLISDEAMPAVGLGVGAVAGVAVAKVVEGMPTQPSPAQVQHEYATGATAKEGAPIMTQVTRAQEATVGGLTVLGLAAAFAYTSLRARRANRQD